MKKVLAGLVTVAVAVVAVPTVAIGGVDFDKVVETPTLKVEFAKNVEQVEVTTSNNETNAVVTASNNGTNLVSTVQVETQGSQVNVPVTETPTVVVANETTAVVPANTKQELATTTQASTTAEVVTTTVALETTQEVKQEEVNLGANDLFGLVGHPGNEYNTPEFQAKWDAMMAERTVNE